MTSLAAQWQTRLKSRAITVRMETWDEDECAALATGSRSLDFALGTGGFPRGKVVEVYGKESTGKTTLALAAIAECGKRGGKAAILETEHKFSKAWAQKQGVNFSHTLLIDCAQAIECIRSLCEIINSGEFDLVVVDSLAGLIWNDDPGSGDASGEAERILERCLPLLSSEAHRTKTSLLFLNQIRMEREMVFGDPVCTVGGQVLRHTCSIRIHLTKHLPLKRGHEVFGSIIKATVTKNSLAKCWETALLPYTYTQGLDTLYELVQLSKLYRLFDERKAALEFEGVSLGRTELEAYNFILGEPGLAETLRNRLIKAMEAARQAKGTYSCVTSQLSAE